MSVLIISASLVLIIIFFCVYKFCRQEDKIVYTNRIPGNSTDAYVSEKIQEDPDLRLALVEKNENGQFRIVEILFPPEV